MLINFRQCEFFFQNNYKVKTVFGFLKKKPPHLLDTSEKNFRRVLEMKIPETAVNYIILLWTASPFNFAVARSRKTCLGNYQFKHQRHYISVNGDSNPYSFLITLIHEIAHQHVTINKSIFRRNPAPHGLEWKTTFSKLMKPMLTESVFPADILNVLKKHMENPAASSTKDQELVKVLSKYSENEDEGHSLEILAKGKVFVFKNKKYRKIEDRRTRTLVECMVSKKKYTIPSFAKIIPTE